MRWTTSLGFLLEGALFSPKETRKIVIQLCRALWVLHSLYTSPFPVNRRRMKFCPAARWRISRTLPRGLTFKVRTVSNSSSSLSDSHVYKQAEHTVAGELFLIVTDVSVQIGLFHQFLLQIAGRFGFHCSRPFTFPPKYYILIL